MIHSMAEIRDEHPSLLFGEIPFENRGCTLGNYDPRNKDEKYALRLAHELVEYNEGPAGLLLVGANGNGKTHLAVGIARAVAERGRRAAFLTFKRSGLSYSSVPLPEDLDGSDWWDREGRLVRLSDLIVVDDIPGALPPGSRQRLQQLVHESFIHGRRLVMTSNLPAPEIVLQISYPIDTGSSATDSAMGIVERMRESWQTVEFAGASYRKDQAKWWDGVARPETMPRTLDDITAGPERLRDAILILGGAILEMHEGVEGPHLDRLRRLLEKYKLSSESEN